MKTMKTFNPMQYLAIDIANHFGLDKENYEYKIQWVKDNINNLESLEKLADEPILYAKAVNALRLSQRSKPTGHTVAFDSAASGLQLMSLLMNCKSGMELTGLVHPDKRVDAYTEITNEINKLLKQDGLENFKISRKDAKQAVMTALYGSQAVPKRVFGEELVQYFYKAMAAKVNGAWQLLHWLLSTHQGREINQYTMPDGHTVYLPSVVQKYSKVNVTTLGYYPRFIYYDVASQERDISIAANAVHSIDALVLREVVRKCNYNQEQLELFIDKALNTPAQVDANFWVNQKYKEAQMACIGFITQIKPSEVCKLELELKHLLVKKAQKLLSYPSFEVVTVHDSFACHANHVQKLREYYNDTLVELYLSNTLSDLLTQLTGDEAKVDVGDKTLADVIRHSNYGIC